MKLILIAAVMISESLCSQPLLDLGKFYIGHSSLKSIHSKANAIESDLIGVSLNIPIELRKNGDAFIINPFFERDHGSVSGTNFNVLDKGFMLGFLKKDGLGKWTLLTGFILRQNKDLEKEVDKDWQYGGVMIASYQRTASLLLKFGLYYNREFFGNYFVPLVGIDWQINTRNILFGVLPGNLVLEHKFSSHLYGGFCFRALTNSYRLQTIDPCFSGDCSAKNYLRVDDNQLGFYGDVYVTKRIVMSAEGGYTVLRRYRYGLKGSVVNTYVNYSSDNFYVRAGLAYRLRFR